MAVLTLWGCASATPPPTPVARPFDDVRRVAIIVSGESAFAVATDDVQPGRTFDEILKWHPYGGALRPVAKLVHRAINGFRHADDAVAAAQNLEGISPGSSVARAMARVLQASQQFGEVRTLDRELTADDRMRGDVALVRVTVPSWGIVQVRQDDPKAVSGFADVRAEMVTDGTGVVLWKDTEDVTHPESAPVRSFVRDREFARDTMMAVLDRAGQRLANELLYARSAGR